jgi:hypothetical protein
LDSQGRAAFEDVEFLTLFAFGELLQKPWLPLTAGVIPQGTMNRIYVEEYGVGPQQLIDMERIIANSAF